MRIIIPMAGIGKRMRPHTLTTPKPLIPVAGKPIVQHLVESLIESCGEKPEEIAFITGNFGKDAENRLLSICHSLGTKGRIYYQHEALGTAHAINCAAESLKGNVIIAFADTLFRAGFTIDPSRDAVIWVHKVDNPSSFGVVTLNEKGQINRFVEKPASFVSDLAIIGIYYFKDGENLNKELEYLMHHNIIKSGEFQLTDALENMMNKGMGFYTAKVDEWLDCGNKDATIYTNRRILEFKQDSFKPDPSAKIENSVIKEPCYIGENVSIADSVIGPYVSVGKNSIIQNSIITNTIIQDDSHIADANLDNSMIGNHVDFKGKLYELNIGDFTTFS